LPHGGSDPQLLATIITAKADVARWHPPVFPAVMAKFMTSPKAKEIAKEIGFPRSE